MKLPAAAWQQREGLAGLLAALDAEGATRFVGGAVRDTLLGLDVFDVDLATRLRPDDVLARLRAAAIKAVPTGIAHGTVTAVLPSGPVEVTTLRRDVATDGRHAEVVFSDDWREDAARRDFTINALSADTASLAIHDYFGGSDDLAAGRVRFIGEPLTRIAEDHLRILRFFRFHARFGTGAPDAAALTACAARANDLMALSRERIADELLKLLALPDPAPTVALMVDRGILEPVLPEIATDGVDRLAMLVRREAALGVAPAAQRRLAALLPPDPAAAVATGAKLKLSKAAQKRLGLATAPFGDGPGDPRPLAYRIGLEGTVDQMLLAPAELEGARSALALLDGWERPRLPIGGGVLVALGLSAGPEVAAALQAVERRWIEEGFPDRPRVEEIARNEVAQRLRSRQ